MQTLTLGHRVPLHRRPSILAVLARFSSGTPDAASCPCVPARRRSRGLLASAPSPLRPALRGAPPRPAPHCPYPCGASLLCPTCRHYVRPPCARQAATDLCQPHAAAPGANTQAVSAEHCMPRRPCVARVSCTRLGRPSCCAPRTGTPPPPSGFDSTSSIHPRHG